MFVISCKKKTKQKTKKHKKPQYKENQKKIKKQKNINFPKNMFVTFLF